MSYPTTQAFIHAGSWGPGTRQHPLMAWMEQYTREFDRSRGFADASAKPEAWMTEDFT